jgi:hypothetical protein
LLNPFRGLGQPHLRLEMGREIVIDI